MTVHYDKLFLFFCESKIVLEVNEKNKFNFELCDEKIMLSIMAVSY